MVSHGISPFLTVAVMAGFAALPFLLLGVTSYVKLSVVFGLLRLALGAQQLPSAAITSTLAMLLTCFIMKPVWDDIQNGIGPVLSRTSEGAIISSGPGAMTLLSEIAEGALPPVRRFLARHSSTRERVFFIGVSRPDLAGREAKEPGQPECHTERGSGTPSEGESEVCFFKGEGILTLAAAFLVSELRNAFSFGFLLFLPFLVIDLVVANLLVGLGMSMVSPSAIALPLKIYLFVATDSWFLLVRSLIRSYQ